jgi:PAS domain S-box-containing protein
MERDRESSDYNILLVEDNPGDRLLISEYLKEYLPTVRTTEAATYKEAAFAIQGNNDFHLILLDLTLPDKSGESLIKSIISISGNCPVIVLTGFTDLDFGRKSLSFGIDDYLIKDDITAQTLYKSILYSMERRQRSLELQESQRQYKNLFMLSPQPMWVYDTVTFKFLDVNDAAIDHYGYSKEEFLAMTILQIRPPDEIPHLLNSIADRKSNDMMRQRGLFRHRKKNGDVITVSIHSSGIFYGTKQYRLVLSDDVTERQNYVNAIEKQNTSLREIAWIQSHLFRAPLARLLALVEVAREGSYDEELPQERVLQFIAEAASELDELIKGITAKTDGINLEFNHEA